MEQKDPSPRDPNLARATTSNVNSRTSFVDATDEKKNRFDRSDNWRRQINGNSVWKLAGKFFSVSTTQVITPELKRFDQRRHGRTITHLSSHDANALASFYCSSRSANVTCIHRSIYAVCRCIRRSFRKSSHTIRGSITTSWCLLSF